MIRVVVVDDEAPFRATYKSIPDDLGINRATLREWVLRDRERRGVAAAAPLVQLCYRDVSP